MQKKLVFYVVGFLMSVLCISTSGAAELSEIEKARNLLYSGQQDEAGAVVDRLFSGPSVEKNTSEAYFTRAMVLKAQWKYDEAIAELKALIARDKDVEIRARIEIADAYIKRLDCTDKVCPKSPDDIRAAQIELDAVLTRLSQMASHSPWTPERQRYLCSAQFLGGLAYWSHKQVRDTNKALSLLKEAEACPDVAQYAQYWTAQVYHSERQYNKMLAKLKDAGTGKDQDFAKKMDESIAQWEQGLSPWHISVSVGTAYDSNVVAKPNEEIPGLAVANKSDISAIATATIRYQPHFDSGFLLAAQYDLYTQIYSKLHRYDTIGNSLGLTIGQEIVRDTFRAYLQTSYSYFMMDQKSYMSLLTFKPTLEYTLWRSPVNSTLKLQGGVGYSARNMMNQIYSADENRDANVYSAFANLFYSFANGNGLLALRTEAANEDTKGVNWDNRWYRIGFDGGLPFSCLWDSSTIDKFTLLFGAEFMEQYFKNVHTVFDVKRHDRTLSGTLGLAYRIAKNIDARLTYTYSDVYSNIALYKYTRNLFYFGVSFGI